MLISVNSEHYKEFKVLAGEVISCGLTARQLLELRSLMAEKNKEDRNVIKRKAFIWTKERIREREDDILMRKSLISYFLIKLKERANEPTD